tara:strand:+ start:71 stop:412 length:342 start_codon:yes stop_codon:yes gene_type:complete
MTKRVSADLVVGAAVGGCGDGLAAAEVVFGTVVLLGTGDEVGSEGAVEASGAASVWAAVISVSVGVARDCSGTAAGVQVETVIAIDNTTKVLTREFLAAVEHIKMIIHVLSGR